MEELRLRQGRERSVLRRHPWIFAGAVEAAPSAGAEPGALVKVVSSGGEALGWAWHSPSSSICARMVSFGDAPPPGEKDLRGAVMASIARRESFFVDGRTDAVRLINAENDFLPGVVADMYAGHVVCQFTSAGADARKDGIAAALMEFAPGCKGVSERRDASARTKEGLETGGFVRMLGEEPPEKIEISENGNRFLVDVRKGHKTGFYLDQRDARNAAGPLANGREVLNCFCYTGGFGIYAAAAGAARVEQVDASAEALAAAKENERLSHCCGTKMEYVQADVFRHLRECRDRGRSFDMIVLDPPKFADGRSQAMKAARGYKDINLLAMKLLRPGGVLATFSCSGAIDDALFSKILAEAAADAGRDMLCTAKTGQAADHPVALAFPEGRYLKGAILVRA